MLLRNSQQTKRSAFTLMEIIIVVAIILILAGAGAVVLPRFLADSQVSRAKADCKTLQQAMSAYYTKHKGVWPPNLAVLAERQEDGGPAYIEIGTLTDPWGNPYILDTNTRNSRTDMPLIYSQGAPGQNIQIRNWEEGQ